MNSHSQCQPTNAQPKLSERERKALEVLADAGGAEDCGYLSFKGIAHRSGLDPSVVRRTVRALARKGFAQYGKGLWTDEGALAGAGYCATKQGLERCQLLADRSAA